MHHTQVSSSAIRLPTWSIRLTLSRLSSSYIFKWWGSGLRVGRWATFHRLLISHIWQFRQTLNYFAHLKYKTMSIAIQSLVVRCSQSRRWLQVHPLLETGTPLLSTSIYRHCDEVVSKGIALPSYHRVLVWLNTRHNNASLDCYTLRILCSVMQILKLKLLVTILTYFYSCLASQLNLMHWLE